MNIVVISNLYPPHYLGGYEILCHQVNRTFRARGHEVAVLTSTFGGLAPQPDPPRRAVHPGPDELLDGIPVQRALEPYVPFGEPACPAKFRRLRTARRNRRVAEAFIQARAPDVIFLWSQLRITVGAALAAEASGIPVAYTMNDDHLAGYGFGHFGLRPATLAHCVGDRLLFRGITHEALRLDYVTCISECVKEDLIARGLPLAHARVIYQGIPLERFPLRTVVDRFPDGLLHAFDARPLKVLYVGQLHPYKGVHTLLDAVRDVARNRGPGALEVTVVGDGPADYVAHLKERAAATAGAGAPVHFAGKLPHEQLPAIYRAHDVFVFPSVWREPFGLTHLEAMASGTPVVSTAEGGHGEFLRHGENALVFPREDAATLAIHLARLLDHPEQGARLAAHARSLVETRFSLTRYVRDLERFLAEAASPVEVA